MLHQKQKTAIRRSFVFAVAVRVRTPLKYRLRHLKSFAPQHSSKSAESRAQSGGYESPGKPPPRGLLFYCFMEKLKTGNEKAGRTAHRGNPPGFFIMQTRRPKSFPFCKCFLPRVGKSIKIQHENILKSAKLFTNSLKYGFNRVKRQQLRNSIF